MERSHAMKLISYAVKGTMTLDRSMNEGTPPHAGMCHAHQERKGPFPIYDPPERSAECYLACTTARSHVKWLASRPCPALRGAFASKVQDVRPGELVVRGSRLRLGLQVRARDDAQQRRVPLRAKLLGQLEAEPQLPVRRERGA